ncbi:MAG: ribosome silencing factor [Lactobacillales bacterium]|jgi:ribosome-associated protein|nr:ribosome silencing factor [Lactobacillales bacterium]
MIKKTVKKTTPLKKAPAKKSPKAVVKNKKTVVKKAPVKAAKAKPVVSKKTDSVRTLVDFVVKKLDAGKANDIQIIDLKGRSSLADYLVIASGTSTRHVIALGRNLEQELKKKSYRPHLEGDKSSGNWVVLDLSDIIVHIFNPESRAYYSLEEIWKNKK